MCNATVIGLLIFTTCAAARELALNHADTLLDTVCAKLVGRLAREALEVRLRPDAALASTTLGRSGNAFFAARGFHIPVQVPGLTVSRFPLSAVSSGLLPIGFGVSYPRCCLIIPQSSTSSVADFAARWLPPAGFHRYAKLLVLGSTMSRRQLPPGPPPNLSAGSSPSSLSASSPPSLLSLLQNYSNATEAELWQAVMPVMTRTVGYVVGYTVAALLGFEGIQCIVFSYLFGWMGTWLAGKPWLSWADQQKESAEILHSNSVSILHMPLDDSSLFHAFARGLTELGFGSENASSVRTRIADFIINNPGHPILKAKFNAETMKLYGQRLREGIRPHCGGAIEMSVVSRLWGVHVDVYGLPLFQAKSGKLKRILHYSAEQECRGTVMVKLESDGDHYDALVLGDMVAKQAAVTAFVNAMVPLLQRGALSRQPT